MFLVSWARELLDSLGYVSEAKVDGDEALHLPYLYYFLRSDAKLALAVVGSEKLCLS